MQKLAHSRTASARLVERARMVWQAQQGQRVPAIAQQLGLNASTVRTGLKRFNAHGPVSKGAGIKAAIHAVGARLLYLPPYSPDLSPIEPCWSEVKAYLQTAAARIYQVLDRAIQRAVNQVTAQYAQEWFRHCGYSITSN